MALMVLTVVPAAAGPGGTDRPFKGTFAGQLLGFNEDPDYIEARCDDPTRTWAVTSFEGWGTATHLGSTYVYAEHCSYTTEGIPDGTYGEGELTMVADNGDVLIGTYTAGISLSPPPVIGFMDYFTFVDGGTGRFTFASGSGMEVGSVDLGDGSFTLQMEGAISYSKR
jgi:hypothetical protein